MLQWSLVHHLVDTRRQYQPEVLSPLSRLMSGPMQMASRRKDDGMGFEKNRVKEKEVYFCAHQDSHSEAETRLEYPNLSREIDRQEFHLGRKISGLPFRMEASGWQRTLSRRGL